MPIAAVNGTELYYEVAGEGVPIIFLHAGIADSRMWATQVKPLSKEYRVVTFDMRGYGQSPYVDGEYARHEDLRALMDHLDIRQAVLVGCSLGGMVAFDFALSYPSRVKAIIGVGPGLSGHKFNWPDIPLIQSMEAAEEEAERTGDYSELCALELKLWVIGPEREFSAVSEEVRRLAFDMNMLALVSDFKEGAKALELDPPAAQRLGDLSCPVLLILGENDLSVIHDKVAFIRANAPDVQQITMANAAHLPNMEHPQQFNQIVLDFMDSL
ncbi:MAG: alpha/beta hydrolase [Anaerolineae bacterium]|nr:alpha/beta hydrolase [Anaerolineae bacterium]